MQTCHLKHSLSGLVSIDWSDDKENQQLTPDSPILAILHTLTGDSEHYLGFMRYATSLGWRSCVLNRRGHSGMPLRTPNFCVIGNVDDTVAMVSRIRQLYPDNFLGLAGISAGSGQVVSFAGREGDRAGIDVLASLCPAWNLEDAFVKLHQSHPRLDAWLTRGLQDYFVNRPDNQEVFEGLEDVVDKVNQASSIDEFMRAAYPLAGCLSYEQFLKEYNPMNYISGMKTPTLVLNALDDFVSLRENIDSDLVEGDTVEQVVLVVTKQGGHIAYNEANGGSYMWRLTMNFFEGVRREIRKQNGIVDS